MQKSNDMKYQSVSWIILICLFRCNIIYRQGLWVHLLNSNSPFLFCPFKVGLRVIILFNRIFLNLQRNWTIFCPLGLRFLCQCSCLPQASWSSPPVARPLSMEEGRQPLPLSAVFEIRFLTAWAARNGACLALTVTKYRRPWIRLIRIADLQ